MTGEQKLSVSLRLVFGRALLWVIQPELEAQARQSVNRLNADDGLRQGHARRAGRGPVTPDLATESEEPSPSDDPEGRA